MSECGRGRGRGLTKDEKQWDGGKDEEGEGIEGKRNECGWIGGKGRKCWRIGIANA